MPDSSTVFYSWQDNLPRRTNRSFILEALKRACKRIRADDAILVEPRVDHDTLGEPGAVDIGTTILRKIEASAAFVADISIVARAKGRSFPNSNVIFELGFASNSLTLERVVLLFNEAMGDPSELPFDLRQKRLLRYTRSESGEGTSRSELAKDLEGALRMILERVPSDEAESVEVGSEDLYRRLITGIAQVRDRDPALSEEARTMLRVAVDDESGLIVRGETAAGTSIGTNNGTTFLEHRSSPREVALWEGALEELVDARLVEDRKGQNFAFYVTRIGFEVADRLPEHGETGAGGAHADKSPFEPSEGALTILLRAASHHPESDGIVVRSESMAGLQIALSRGEAFLEPGAGPREQALWEGALEELVEHGLVQDKKGHGNVFSVTDRGYKLADQITVARGRSTDEQQT